MRKNEFLENFEIFDFFYIMNLCFIQINNDCDLSFQQDLTKVPTRTTIQGCPWPSMRKAKNIDHMHGDTFNTSIQVANHVRKPDENTKYKTNFGGCDLLRICIAEACLSFPQISSAISIPSF